jgi:hypothetical protein
VNTSFVNCLEKGSYLIRARRHSTAWLVRAT